MGETTYIVIDEKEKRVMPCGHNGSLDAFVGSLAKNPTTISGFNQAYHEIAKEPFFSDGNRPRVPEQLSLETIRAVLGMGGAADDEVLAYWKRASFYEDPNSRSFGPDAQTEHDIPELTEKIIDEWKQQDPDAENYPTANDYRRSLCNDGIVVADLRKKELRYISRGAFDIPRTRTGRRITRDLQEVTYTLPASWKIVEE